MIFGLICLALTALSIAAVLAPLLRGDGADATPVAGAATDIDIYRDQLAAVDSALARGAVS